MVPLLLATDKTLLTQHQGDVSGWPVYLTIGNLNRKTRRSQKRPGQLLVGFLPVLPKSCEAPIGEESVKARVWHLAMGTLLERE